MFTVLVLLPHVEKWNGNFEFYGMKNLNFGKWKIYTLANATWIMDYFLIWVKIPFAPSGSHKTSGSYSSLMTGRLIEYTSFAFHWQILE